MFNNTFQRYTISEDGGDGNLYYGCYLPDDDDSIALYDDDAINEALDFHYEYHSDHLRNSAEELAYEQTYPRFGHTTADVFEDAEAWLAAKFEEIESDLAEDRKIAFAALKAEVQAAQQRIAPAVDATFTANERSISMTKKQQSFAGSLAREIRDTLQEREGSSPSAHHLSKYFTIDDLIEMRDMLRDGKRIEIK